MRIKFVLFASATLIINWAKFCQEFLVAMFVVQNPHSSVIRSISIKVLLHCGDFTNFGDANELDEFNEELAKLPHKYKITIAGNHELGFEDGEDLEGRKADKVMWELGSGRRGTPRGYERLTNCIYLHDNSVKVFQSFLTKIYQI